MTELEDEHIKYFKSQMDLARELDIGYRTLNKRAQLRGIDVKKGWLTEDDYNALSERVKSAKVTPTTKKQAATIAALQSDIKDLQKSLNDERERSMQLEADNRVLQAQLNDRQDYDMAMKGTISVFEAQAKQLRAANEDYATKTTTMIDSLKDYIAAQQVELDKAHKALKACTKDNGKSKGK